MSQQNSCKILIEVCDAWSWSNAPQLRSCNYYVPLLLQGFMQQNHNTTIVLLNINFDISNYLTPFSELLN